MWLLNGHDPEFAHEPPEAKQRRIGYLQDHTPRWAPHSGTPTFTRGAQLQPDVLPQPSQT